MLILLPFRWQTAVDFLTLSAAFYLLLTWARQARALRIAIGIVGLHAVATLARNFDLVITAWVLDVAAGLLVVLLLVVFQPELRHAVIRLDSLLRVWPRPAALLTRTSRASSNAAFALARARVGALIVIVRGDSIAELTSGGVPIGAEVSAEILEAIFPKSSPLHDGAVVVQGDCIRMANVILPLTHVISK